MTRHRILILVAFAALILHGGCKDDPTDPSGDNTPAIPSPFPGTEQQLMANFESELEAMDLTKYLQVLDEDFRFYMQESTVDQYALDRNFFDHAEESVIVRNMFAGESVNDTTAGITSIRIDLLQPAGDWGDSENSDFPDARWAEYNVAFLLTQGSGSARRVLTVDGRIDFYLSSEQVYYEGRMQTLYRMVGQVDRTATSSHKDSEEESWGGLHAMYR